MAALTSGLSWFSQNEKASIIDKMPDVGEKNATEATWNPSEFKA